jgi:hypothetical protein
MKMSLSNLVLQLVDKKQFSFRDAKGVYLECTAGMVWLTVEGQSGDFLLSQGERMRIDSNGHALVEGLPSGSFRLVSRVTGLNRRTQKFDWHIGRIVLFPRLASVSNE